jgi:phosphoribosylformimino-5-aminoimidazole carboxamide ribotide isomerase
MRNPFAFKVFPRKPTLASKPFSHSKQNSIKAEKLKIIPVIDVLGGVAVHAVRGERNQYEPLKSVLAASSDPLDVAATFRQLGFAELYVADLDAILKNQPNYTLIQKIAEATELKLMVDAGVTDLERAKELLANQVSKVVVGTETLRHTDFVETAVRTLGSDRVVVSLDLKNRRLLSNFELEKTSDPIALVKQFQKAGVEQMIVLDLARVGSGEGVDTYFLKSLFDEVDIEVYVGGGVRNLTDLLALNRLGVSGVLLATALHSGNITVDELRRAKLSLR